MKKSMSTFRRLLAVLLAFALVIGYVPVLDVAAATTGTVDYPNNRPAVTIERKVNEIQETKPTDPDNSEPTGDGEDSEPTGDGEDSEPTGDGENSEDAVRSQEIVTTYTYTYTVTASEGFTVDSIVWKNGEEVVDDDDGTTPNEITVGHEALTAVVTCGIYQITVAASEAQSSETKVWSATAGNIDSVVAGVPFELPVTQFTLAEGTAAEVKYEFSGVAVNQPENAKPYATTTGNLTITEYALVGETRVFETTYEVTVGKASTTATFNVISGTQGQNDWYTSDVTVEVKVDNVAGLVDTSYLETVSTENGVAAGEWALTATGWAKTVVLSASDTVKYGNQSQEYKIDTTVPEVDEYETFPVGFIVYSYYAEVHYTVGESGLYSVTINDEVYTADEWYYHDAENNVIYIQLPKKLNNPKVQVTNNAGVSSDVVNNGNAIGEMDATITYAKPLKEVRAGVKTEVYANADTVITLTITGAQDPASNKGLDMENIEVIVNGSEKLNDVDWVYAEGTATATVKVPENTVYDKIVLKAQNKGKYPQRIEETLDVRFINDSTAPVLNVSTKVDAAATYYAGVATYTFTVTDDHMTNGVADLSLEYVREVNGVNEEPVTVPMTSWTASNGGKTYTTQIKIDDAKLVSYTVTGKDNVGNLLTGGTMVNTLDNGAGTLSYNGPALICDDIAPTATVHFSENVTAIFGRGGKVYLWLDAPVGDAEAEPKPVDVTATVTFTDRNLSLDLLKYDGSGTIKSDIKANQDSTITYEKTVTVKPDEAAVLSLDLTLTDIVLNPVKVNVADVDGTSYPFEITVTDGQFALDFNLDRRRPTSTEGEGDQVDTALPAISITSDTDFFTNADGLTVYKAAPVFNFSVNDGTPESANSGLAEVTWKLTDKNGLVEGDSLSKNYDAKKDAVYNDSFNVTAKLTDDKIETNEVTLTVTVTDAAGNSISNIKTFGVDTKAPVITYSYDNNEVYNDLFYNKERNATVTVTDLNLDHSTISIVVNGIAFTGAANEDGTYTVPFDVDGGYEMVINANDLGGLSADEQKDGFVIDMTAPVVIITQTPAEGGALVNSAEGVHYYNKQLTYTAEIIDANLSETIDEGHVNLAVLELYFEDSSDNKTVSLGDGLEIKPSKTREGLIHYVYTFTVEDGKVLTGVKVNAVDNANNAVEGVNYNGTEAAFSYNDEEGMYEYTDTVVVDETAPEVVVTKTIANEGKRFQTYTVDGVEYAYYPEEVTYEIQVTDKFLDTTVGKCVVTVSYTDGDEILELAEDFVASSTLADEDKYVYRFTLDGTRVMKSFSIDLLDNAGNAAEEVNVEGASDTTFTQNGSVWTYTGLPIVVDTTAPTATLKFSENVKSFYVNNNVVYAILTNPTKAESGKEATQNAETITVTVEVEDKNLAIGNGMEANTFAWEGKTPVNADTELTYVATSEPVNPDGTAVFKIDARVCDLAGNPLVDFNSETTQDGTTFLPVDVDETGAFAYAVSLDRLRPTSGKLDSAAPTITIEPTITPTKTADGLDLFNGAFQFKMNVNDGEKSEKNSGLKYVKWTIEDAKGVVQTVENAGKEYTKKDEDNKETQPEQVFNDDYVIDVDLATNPGETNSVVLRISAEDNVGNLITYQKKFAVDNLAPRVTITQSNQSAQNGFYFNNDQVITVEINELNFDPTKSTFTTQVPSSGWQLVGENLYRTTLTYNTDGDYTFAMATTDLANNSATIDYTTGLVALPSFTIDKTAPIIRVNFNPFVPVDTDLNLVQYFDEVRNITVTIEEHNFRTNEIVANLGTVNLGAWYSNGDIHTASAVFPEGNGYVVNVQYTDLAGNVAVPYTSPRFSVDLEAPVIEITKGNMRTGTLNIVPDDLLLGFTITDHQENLKNFSVEVIHLNNNYEQTKVEGAEYYTKTEGDRTTGYIDFTNIEAVKENDGIYTVRVSALDYAGHLVNFPDVVFSLNRFGSTFTVTDSYTSSFLTAGETDVIYQSQVTNPLVITEINPNRVWQNSEKSVEGSIITVAANGSSVSLTPGKDYEVKVTEKGNGGSKWYEYTYTINPDVFNNADGLVDGDYTIFFYSEDEAGNKNTNESNMGSALLLGADGNYSGKVSFTLDHKAPVVTVLNIEEGGQYVEANRNVEINVSDNTPVAIAVYINDVLVEYVETTAGQPLTSDWLSYDAASGNYILNMSEKDEIQNVRIVVTDSANNVFEQTIGDITLTENLWIQFINNEVLVICSVVGLAGLIFFIILLLKKRKEKKEENAAV